MERRKFITGLGALVTGSAAAMGTGAFSSANVDRSISVNVAGDSSAYLGLDASVSEYANEASNGELELLFDGSGNQDGEGLNPNSDTDFRNVFKVINNGTNDIRVKLQDVPSTAPIAFRHSSTEDDTTSLTDLSVFPNSPQPQADESYGPEVSNLDLTPGDEAYVHVAFFLNNDNPNNSLTNSASAIPDSFGFYATGMIDDDGGL